jgi:hypothetical protein
MTRRPSSLLLVLTILAGLIPAFSAVAAAATPCGAGVEALRIDGVWLCTHGNDDPPPGVDTTELPATDELFEARYGEESMDAVVANSDEDAVLAAGAVSCAGDGVSGARIQLVYARAANVASRYSTVLPLLQQYAADADDVVNVSAGRVGDGRRVRYVTDENCVPQVMNVALSETGDDTFSNMINELVAKGLNSAERKYVVFMDAAVGICGLGQVYLNDRGDQLNPNNTGRAMYARVDTSCWQHALAHEMLHTMGAVQNSSPNSSGAGHCTDEVDVMCYKDRSTTVVRQVCTRAGQVDCNNDDYFHPNPAPASYLDTKWNVARSRYLANTAPPPPPPTTVVTIPASGYPGLAWPVRADISNPDNASVVWSSTRSECWFADPHAAVTTWTCPASSAGSAAISVMVTEGTITTPYSRTVALLYPSQQVPTSTSMAVTTTSIVTGESLKLNGSAVQSATLAHIAGLPVRAYARPKGAYLWSRIADGVTNANGDVSFTVTPTRNTSYRLTAGDTPVWALSSSPSVDVSVKTKLTTKINSKMVAGLAAAPDTTTRISGAVSPDKAGDRIQLAKYRYGAWRIIRSKTINAASGFAFYISPSRVGRHKLRVIKPGDTRNIKSIRDLSLTVG